VSRTRRQRPCQGCNLTRPTRLVLLGRGIDKHLCVDCALDAYLALREAAGAPVPGTVLAQEVDPKGRGRLR
jgi:hypothetical protein